MSATNRGSKRVPSDFYATPFPAFQVMIQHLPDGVRYFDPCAGDGRLVSWLRECGHKADGADLVKRKGALVPGLGVRDFLTDNTRRDFTLTNPPFTIAQEVAAHALAVSREVLLLLRLNMLASDTRAAWWRKNEPSALFVLKDRPSFVMACTCTACEHKWTLPSESVRPVVCPVCGVAKPKITTSDATDYAWFYWGRRYQGIFHP